MAYKPPVDESQLIKDLQNPVTAKAGFDTLMRLYGEKLYWQIRKLVASHEDANDILQNSFLKAWNNLNNFRGEARLSTWLYKIAINESINFINKQKNIAAVTESSEDAGFLVNSLIADEYFDGDDLQLLLQKAIFSLPEKQRLVFNMKYFDDMKYEEISDILGTSVGALKASYHHAVKKIESFVRNNEISGE